MSILKKRSAEATTSNTPAFEAGEAGDETLHAGSGDTPATNTNAAGDGGVTDVEHVETKVERKPADEQVHDVQETKASNGKTVSAAAAEGAAAKLAAAAEGKDAKSKQAEKAAEPKGAAEPPKADAAPAAESKETAVVVPQRKVLSTFLSGNKDMPNPLADLKGAFVKAGIDISFGTFTRLKVDAGVIASAEGKEAGQFVELQVVSYDPSWIVGTGTDDEDSKKHVRFSDDGKTIRGAGEDDEHAGKTCEDYREYLRENGYEKAGIKEYLQMSGVLVDATNADVPFMHEVVTLQLSPESRKKFESYVINRAVKARMGRIKETSGNPVVRFTVERVKGKERSYFILVPTDGLTAPVEM